jgi:hypothetical protein
MREREEMEIPLIKLLNCSKNIIENNFDNLREKNIIY